MNNDNVHGLVYDGREFMTFNEKQRSYTRNAAPPTLDSLVRELASSWRIEAPLAELFYWGNGKDDNAAITSAQVLGVERVDTTGSLTGGKTCQVAPLVDFHYLT